MKKSDRLSKTQAWMELWWELKEIFDQANANEEKDDAFQT